MTDERAGLWIVSSAHKAISFGLNERMRYLLIHRTAYRMLDTLRLLPHYARRRCFPILALQIAPVIQGKTQNKVD